MSDLLVDRLGNIVVADGVARLDFLGVSGLDAEKKPARMAPSVRLTIPVSGLPQAIEMLDKMRGELLCQAQAAPESTHQFPRPPARPAFPPFDPSNSPFLFFH